MAQYARPNADDVDGNWTPSTGTDLYATIDETSYNDSDYNSLGGFETSTFQVELSSVTDPTSSSGHIIRVRGTTELSFGETMIYLYQDTTQIASFDPGFGTSPSTKTYTLSSAEANSITDYGALELHCYGDTVFGDNTLTWAEFEVPDASGGTATSDDQDAFLRGGQNTSDDQDAFLHGGVATSDNQIAFLKGSQDTSDSQSAFLDGQDNAVDNNPAFLHGGVTATSNTPCFTEGAALQASDSQSAFLEGRLPATGSQSAYMEGLSWFPLTDDFTGSDSDPWDTSKWDTEVV